MCRRPTPRHDALYASEPTAHTRGRFKPQVTCITIISNPLYPVIGQAIAGCYRAQPRLGKPVIAANAPGRRHKNNRRAFRYGGNVVHAGKIFPAVAVIGEGRRGEQDGQERDGK